MDRLETATRSIALLAKQIEARLSWFRANNETLTDEAKQDVYDFANSIQTEAEKIAVATAPADPIGFRPEDVIGF